MPAPIFAGHQRQWRTVSANAVLTVLATNAYTQIVRGDSPISYWRLDETTGSTAYDTVGANNGTYNNVFLNQTPGYSTIDSDPCIGLPAPPSGSYVSVANYQAFNFFTNPSPTFTLEGWAYFTNDHGHAAPVLDRSKRAAARLHVRHQRRRTSWSYHLWLFRLLHAGTLPARCRLMCGIISPSAATAVIFTSMSTGSPWAR